MWPFEVCKVARRIIAKACLTVIRRDIQEAAGSIQLRAGEIAGREDAVHAMRAIFHDENTDAMLHVDAGNASNFPNCSAALLNIQLPYLTPSISVLPL